MSATTRFSITPSSTDTLHTSSSIQYFAQKITIPAYTLRTKALLRFGASFKATGTNSTDTFTYTIYLGTASDNTGAKLAESAAVDLADNEVGGAWGEFQVKTYGAASVGVLAGSGSAVAVTGGTVKTTTFDTTEAQLDFTADMYLIAACTQSVSSASNVARLDSLWCEIVPFAV